MKKSDTLCRRRGHIWLCAVNQRSQPPEPSVIHQLSAVDMRTQPQPIKLRACAFCLRVWHVVREYNGIRASMPVFRHTVGKPGEARFLFDLCGAEDRAQRKAQACIITSIKVSKEKELWLERKNYKEQRSGTDIRTTAAAGHKIQHVRHRIQSYEDQNKDKVYNSSVEISF
ncbi:hypothetical protein RRG08_010975 [Elysia crispata]|uniref:Uncharacterized protein n=1 Tax=Elysia crispata TaxID=231223 RepID=A0AAE1CN50_9GAST|nr:hypothetical protein RRG08_010975 [Elysia crispata]